MGITKYNNIITYNINFILHKAIQLCAFIIKKQVKFKGENMTSEEIKRKLWEGANNLRGSMDASRYKDYMLGLMFYKFLSDKTLEQFKNDAGSKNIGQELVEEYKIRVEQQIGRAHV